MSKQLIALQGNHQDKIDFTQEQSRNEGNFIAVLRLLAKNNQVCKFYWGCLWKCPHYSLIADEVTSHDKEILSVCLRFLEIDHANFQIKLKKHEVLLSSEDNWEKYCRKYLQVLQTHKIDVRNCRRQAYDTTAWGTGSY